MNVIGSAVTVPSLGLLELKLNETFEAYLEHQEKNGFVYSKETELTDYFKTLEEIKLIE